MKANMAQQAQQNQELEAQKKQSEVLIIEAKKNAELEQIQLKYDLELRNAKEVGKQDYMQNIHTENFKMQNQNEQKV
jgi:hypothetical protein